MRKRGLTPTEKIKILKNRLENQKWVGFLSIYGKDGKLIDVFQTSVFEAELYLDSISIKKAITSGIQIRILRNTSNNSPSVMEIIIPWKINSKILGFIGLGVETGWLSEYVTGLSFKRFGRYDLVYVLDSNGNVIAPLHPSLPQRIKHLPFLENPLSFEGIFAKELSICRDYRRNNEKVVGTLVTIPSLKWAIVVEQPHSMVYATFVKTRNIAILITLFIVGIAFFLSVILSRRISEPIVALTEGIKRVSERDFSSRVNIRSKNEIGILGKMFNQMVDKLQYYREEIEKETRRRIFLGRYLLPHLVQELLSHEDEDIDFALPRRGRATVVFIDIEDFTKKCEHFEADRIISLLNAFFGSVTSCIFKHQGTIDKFIGDCVMALFGVPYPLEDAEERAVKASINIAKHFESLKEEFISRFGTAIEIKAGIATGEVVVGSVGTSLRLDYTAIGPPVNRASRIEELADSGEILVDEETVKNIRDKSLKFELKGTFSIKGFSNPLKIYRVIID